MIPRTAVLSLAAVLPLAVNALPQPQHADIVAPDVSRSVPIAVDVRPVAERDTEPITIIATREDGEEEEDVNAAAKGKGGGGVGVHTGSSDGVMTGSPPRAGFALVVGVGAVVMASLMG